MQLEIMHAFRLSSHYNREYCVPNSLQWTCNCGIYWRYSRVISIFRAALHDLDCRQYYYVSCRRRHLYGVADVQRIELQFHQLTTEQILCLIQPTSILFDRHFVLNRRLKKPTSCTSLDRRRLPVFVIQNHCQTGVKLSRFMRRFWNRPSPI